MTDKQKEPYVKKSNADEQRYQKQLKELDTKGYFINDDGVKSTDVMIDPKKKYGKDCVVPKRPISAYLAFTTDMVNKLKEKEKIEKHTDAMKRCGEIWSKYSDKEKKKYNDLHDKDVKRYDKQMLELHKKGFFIMDDGSKSSDHQAKIKKKR